MSSISIKSNTQSLMSALSVTFTDKTKVLSEIIQNSRRANASRIDITYFADDENKSVNAINIIDDGIGISNMQDIFTIGGSGWDEQVTTEENPYGIGSIAMLYACQSLSIDSIGKTIEVNCSDVITGEAFSINESQYDKDGTSIWLNKTVFTLDQLNNALRDIARYSSIPIYVNGELLASECALNTLETNPDFTCLATSLGTVAFRRVSNDRMHVILQELCVSKPYSADDVYFFANNSFKARMPDRDRLVDEAEALEKIKSVVADAFGDYLQAEKQRRVNDTEALHHWVKDKFTPIVKFARHILNDIDYLPGCAFDSIDYPCLRDAHNAYNQAVDVYKDNVKEQVFTRIGTDIPIFLAALYEKDAQYLKQSLDNGHWFYQQVSSFDEDKAVINVENGRIIDKWVYVGYSDARFGVADGLSVTYENWTQPIKNGAFLRNQEFTDFADEESETFSQIQALCDEYGDCILLNTHEIETVLLQFDSFTNDDNPDDLGLQTALDEVLNLASAAFGVSASDFICRVLPSLPPAIIEQLKASPITLTISESGEVVANAA